MEIKIKIEEGECEYTQQTGNAFVKLVNKDGETNWMGEQALLRAYNMIQSVGVPMGSGIPTGSGVRLESGMLQSSLSVPSFPRVVAQPAVEMAQLKAQLASPIESQQPQEQTVQTTAQSSDGLLKDVLDDQEDLEDIPGVKPLDTSVALEYGKSTSTMSPDVKKKDATLMSLLREDLLEAAGKYSPENTPKGKNPGIPHSVLVGLIGRYASRFVSKENFYNCVSGVVPIPRESFMVLVSNQRALKGYKTTLEMSRNG